MNWISVKDKLPNQDDLVLVVTAGGIYTSAFYIDGDFIEGWYKEDKIFMVTHWCYVVLPKEYDND